jgi:hypothetical protein
MAINTSELEQISATRRDVVVRWLIPERVIFVYGEGKISPAVRDWMNARIIYLMHSCSTSHIHLITDVRHVTQVSLSSITKPSPVLRHPRRGWFISIGASKNWLMQFVLRLVVWMMRLSYRDCDSVHEALTELRQFDPSLPDWDLSKLNLPVELEGE